MILCPTCFKDNDAQATQCMTCGGSLSGITREMNDETIRKKRHRDRMRGNMITGAILCFGLPTLFGIPLSLLPGALIQNLIFGVVFGVPLGYLVNTYARSVAGGAAIGCAIGVVYCGLIMLLFTHQVDMGAIFLGVMTGLLPGAIMGWHVALE